MSNKRKLIIAGAAAAIVSINSFNLFYSEDPSEAERKKRAKMREESQFKRNNSVSYGPPQTPLVADSSVLLKVLKDRNRNYIGKITHLHAWQFFILADRVKHLIERPRLRRDGSRPIKAGPACKHDHFHRLFFTLKWLNDGQYFRSKEADVGWGKSSLQEDNVHVLMAIIEGK